MWKAHLESLDAFPLCGALLSCAFQPCGLLRLVLALRAHVLFSTAQHAVRVLFALLRHVTVVRYGAGRVGRERPEHFLRMHRPRDAALQVRKRPLGRREQKEQFGRLLLDHRDVVYDRFVCGLYVQRLNMEENHNNRYQQSPSGEKITNGITFCVNCNAIVIDANDCSLLALTYHDRARHSNTETLRPP
jgi:hypothetical protein